MKLAFKKRDACALKVERELDVRTNEEMKEKLALLKKLVHKPSKSTASVAKKSKEQCRQN